MGLKRPVGETVKWDKKFYRVIGVIKDMVMQSPYEPVFRTVFVMDGNAQPVIQLRINPAKSTHEALTKIEAAFKNLIRRYRSLMDLQTMTMPENSEKRSVLANSRTFLPYWLFLSVAWAYPAWPLTWQSNEQKRSA